MRANGAALQGVTCAVCACRIRICILQQALTGSAAVWGGQDVSQFGAGAYTGVVTGGMLREFGCRYAIVVRRRSIFGQTAMR